MGKMFVVAIVDKISDVINNAKKLEKHFNGTVVINNITGAEHPQDAVRRADLDVNSFASYNKSRKRSFLCFTYDQHYINRLRYLVYKEKIQANQVLIVYDYNGIYEEIRITPNGKLLNELGDHTFPRGFFDATLDNIFEINCGKDK